MANEWPGDWFSAAEKMTEDKGAGLTNDHGTLYLISQEGSGWLWMTDVPSHLENRC